MTALPQPTSRSAAPSQDPHQLHADAHNALCVALFYLRQPQANVPVLAARLCKPWLHFAIRL